MHEMINDLIHFSLFLVIFSAICAGIESISPAYPMKFNRKELINDFCYSYLERLLAPFIAYIGIDYLNDHILSHSPIPRFDSFFVDMPFIAQLLVVLLVTDFAVYLRHRMMHEFLWPFHSIHHSLEQINWIAKFRLHPFESLIAVIFVTFFAYIIGIDGDVIVAANAVLMAFDIANHLNVNLKFPKPFCYILSCPNYHKWHHGKEREAINKNYVVIFPFIDKLFGTYYFPLDRLPKECGAFYEKIDGKAYEVPPNFFHQLIYPFIYYYKKLKQFIVS